MTMTDTKPLFIRLTLPAGLEEALEGLAREVLRHQPDNILEFAADHFDLLLKKRGKQEAQDADSEKLQKRDSKEDDISEIEDIEDHKNSVLDSKSQKIQSRNNEIMNDKSESETKNEEEIDIDLNDPDVSKAATKIQASFRGHQTRRSLNNKKEKNQNIEDEEDIDLTDPEVGNAATKIQANYRGHMTRKELRNKTRQDIENEFKDTKQDHIDIDLNDQEVQQAATKIQANFRGHKTRKSLKENTPNKEENVELEKSDINIDIDDPDMEHAATKIQASFRGHKTRKMLNEKAKSINNDIAESEIDIDINDPDVELAATKIQASFRGHQTRKSIREQSQLDKNDIKEGDNQFDIDLGDPDVEHAATKIQANFRGHLTRKALKEDEKGDVELPERSNTTNNDDEIIDIDLDDPEVEQAALKIQSSFRGYQKTKSNKENEESNSSNTHAYDDQIDIDINDPDVEKAATKIQASFRGHQTRKSIRENKTERSQDIDMDLDNGKDIDIDLEDPDVQHAATKIQASFRGHQTRKSIRENKTERSQDIDIDLDNGKDIDIDLEDPDVQHAASKIQASFRGHQTRKNLQEKSKNDEKESNGDNCVDEIDIDLEDPQVEEAATKIQASFRGHKTRKELNKETISHSDTLQPEKDALVNNDNQDKEDSNQIQSQVDELEINLDDPDLELAATKIQAGFRGHKTRKSLKDESNFQLDQKNEPGDEIDINLDDPEVEKAATKIQASFRGHQVRKTMTENDSKPLDTDIDIDLNDPEVQDAATKIQAGFRSHQTRKTMKENLCEKPQLDTNQKVSGGEDEIDLNDPEMEHAAIKIQAGFRGHKTRKNLERTNNESVSHDTYENENTINLGDPELEHAATKIQAGFRGHMARKQLDSSPVCKTNDEQENAVVIDKETKNEDEIDIDLDDPEVEHAATLIQAGFRGHKTRKDLKIESDSGEGKISNAELLESEQCLASNSSNFDDIDLNDVELQNAATKIQAGFRGLQTRKELAHRNSDVLSESKSCNKENEVVEDKEAIVDHENEEIDIDLNDPELEMAATKIQAGFKGMKARKEVALKKVNKDGIETTVGEELTNDGLIIETSNGADNEAYPLLERKRFGSCQGNSDDSALSLDDPDTTVFTEEPELITKTFSTESLSMNESDDNCEDENVLDEAVSEIQAGFRRTKAVMQAENLHKEQKHRDAVNTIQAGFKSLQAKNTVNIKKENLKEVSTTRIQAGYKTMMARGCTETMMLMKDPRNINANGEIIESSDEIVSVGAIPFDLHEDYVNNFNNAIESKRGKEEISRDINDPSIHSRDDRDDDNYTKLQLFTTEDDPFCQCVEIYLIEKKMEFNKVLISRKNRQHLSAEFLEINDKGNLPVLTINNAVVKSNSLEICYFIEENVDLKETHPILVPCSNATTSHQNHLLWSSKLYQVRVDALRLGSKGSSLDISRSIAVEDINAEIDEMLKIAGEDEMLADPLSRTIHDLSKVLRIATDQSTYKEHVSLTSEILKAANEELASKDWMISNSFGLVDIQLGILLIHLHGSESLQSQLAARNLSDFLNRFLSRRSVQQVFSTLEHARDHQVDAPQTGATLKTRNSESSDAATADREASKKDQHNLEGILAAPRKMNSKFDEGLFKQGSNEERKEDKAWFDLW